MANPELLARSWRGSVPETALRGHVAVVDTTGRLQGSAGDPEAVTTLRSCVKPVQALLFVEVAAGALGDRDADIAVACASHSGEPLHVATVRDLLQRSGVAEAALGCGAQEPMDPEAGRALASSGETALPVHNNCSGKHAAMLAACAARDWPLAGYMEPDHPCQRAVTANLASLLHQDLDAAPWGIDGCGLPTFGVPLSAIARAFATGPQDLRFRRCQEAMAARPELVAGTGRFDTALLAGLGRELTGKSGGAAVWAGVWRPAGLGIAVKLEAGAADALPPVVLAVLRALGALPASPPAELARFERPQLRNWAGREVGETVAADIRL